MTPAEIVKHPAADVHRVVGTPLEIAWDALTGTKDAIADLTESCARLIHHPQRRLDRAQGERLLLACMQVIARCVDANHKDHAESHAWLVAWHGASKAERRRILSRLAGDWHADSIGSKGAV